jgi:hypothetical protein
MEGLEGVFTQSAKREDRAATRELVAKNARIGQLQEVVTELSGHHVSPQVTTEVVATVNYLKERAGFPVARSLLLLGLPRATYFRWSASGGKQPRPPATTAKSHWLLPQEREAIIAYKRQHPEIGYRRLTYMMIDEGVAAVPPSSVYNVLAQAGLSSRWTSPPGGSHKQGFDQSERPHEQYNTKRLHSALQYLTPADYLQGSEHVCERREQRALALHTGAERRRACRLKRGVAGAGEIAAMS